MSSQLIQFYRMLVYVSNESRFMIFVHFIMHFFLGSELTGGIGPGELTRSNWNTHTRTRTLSHTHTHTRTLSLTHTHTHTLTHTHTHTHTHQEKLFTKIKSINKVLLVCLFLG